MLHSGLDQTMTFDARDPALLWDMLESAKHFHLIKGPVTAERLTSDMRVEAVVVLSIEKLGSAAEKVSEFLKVAHPEIPWSELARQVEGVQDYRAIDYERVARFASEYGPKLADLIGPLVPPEPTDVDAPESMERPTPPQGLAFDVIESFCRRNHIARLWLFGSAARGDFRPESDVDILVEFEEGHTPGLGHFTMQQELAELAGRPVDLLTVNSLQNPFRRKEILGGRRLLYAA